MLKENLNIDEKDIKILSYLMKDPMISQNVIAEKLNLSQPSVFVRLQKLKKKGLLNYMVGMNLNKIKMFLCRVDLTCKNPNMLLDEMKKCPFFVNGFIVSGEHNVSIMLVHDSLKKIDEVVNSHLRSNESVSNIKLNIVVSSAKDYIFNIDLENEISPGKDCNQKDGCKDCTRLNIKP